MRRFLPAVLFALCLCCIAGLFCFEAAAVLGRLGDGLDGNVHGPELSAPVSVVGQDDAAPHDQGLGRLERLGRSAAQQQCQSPRDPPLALAVWTLPPIAPMPPWEASPHGGQDAFRFLPLRALAFRAHPPQAPPFS